MSSLVREEIALAKAEVSEKVSSILRGGAVGIAAGVFAFLGLILLMHAFAWLLDDLFFEGSIWVGFAIEALLFFDRRRIAGWAAYRVAEEGRSAGARRWRSRRASASVRRSSPARPPPPRSHRYERTRSSAPAPASRSHGSLPARLAARPSEIRADIEAQRDELVALGRRRCASKVTELTDWRRQVREHRRELIIGAAVVGFAIGARMVLRRRR